MPSANPTGDLLTDTTAAAAEAANDDSPEVATATGSVAAAADDPLTALPSRGRIGGEEPLIQRALSSCSIVVDEPGDSVQGHAPDGYVEASYAADRPTAPRRPPALVTTIVDLLLSDADRWRPAGHAPRLALGLRGGGCGTAPDGAAPPPEHHTCAYAPGLHGLCISYDTACSAARAASHAELRALQLNECAASLVAGVALVLAPVHVAGSGCSLRLKGGGSVDGWDWRAARLLHWFCEEHQAWLAHIHNGGDEWHGWQVTRAESVWVVAAQPWSDTCDTTFAPFVRWFCGARTNAAFNELDRHQLKVGTSRLGVLTPLSLSVLTATTHPPCVAGPWHRHVPTPGAAIEFCRLGGRYSA
jgi:hypothetical protein